ncbi:MAG: UDP-N-acetylglucosamine 1-carboxyvinyltransferase, partial [FCB group bacterium]|nr:UDP-N-acetylglucosamine 1-carboxyvinyltransferase [FCB group bacterium]
MDKFVIHGGSRLQGEVKIGGSKNAALPLIAAAILAPGKYTITNVPPITDILTMCKLLRMMGGEGRVEDEVLYLDSSEVDKYEAPYELVKTMRASIYVLGPLLARFGQAAVSLPGGCAWGPRPVNLHIEGMKKLGAEIDLDRGYIVAKAKKLRGAEIDLAFPSVGATGNILMAAVKAEGETIINNAACEPDVTALVDFLVSMGAKIEGAGTPVLRITGSAELAPGDFNNIPDRIEAGTFMIAGAITGGEITLNNCRADHCEKVISKLQNAGCMIESGRDRITVKRNGELKPVDVTTAVYPGYPTDLQAQWIALMA